MRYCSTNKLCFDSETIAVEELMANRAKYNYPSGQGPVNVYQCEFCGGYHFTSKGESHPALSKNKDRINKQAEAEYWKDKFKGR